MTETNRDSNYDLEDRTFAFARAVRSFSKRMPGSLANFEDLRQLIRSSGSVGANYIEANEALSKKDFRHRIRIAKKEAKESRYWLRLLDSGGDAELENDRARLLEESEQLMLILGAILRNSG